MSQTQPLGAPDPASLDGLEQVFVPEEQGSLSSNQVSSEVQTVLSENSDATIRGVTIHNDLPSDLFKRGFEGVDEIVSEEIEQSDFSVETIGTVDASRLRGVSGKRSIPPKPAPVARSQVRADELDFVEKQKTEVIGAIVGEDDRVSRAELVSLLEGFINVLKKDGERGLELVRTQQMVPAPEIQEIRVEDKTQELEDMRRLVIEAQETIIKLLTDRVEDRARIATLETELRLLPDLQEQADRAMSVAFKTEEFRSELHKVKYELERYRFASARGHVERGPRSWLSKVRRWFLKSQGIKLRDYSDATRTTEKSNS